MSSAEPESGTTWHRSRQQARQLVLDTRGVHSALRSEAKHASLVRDAPPNEAIAMSAAGGDRCMSSAAAAGAVGHLFAEANAADLAVLMRSIERGDSSVASQIARRILGSIAAPAAPKLPEVEAESIGDAPSSGSGGTKGLLSPRELKVLRLIARGWSNRQIAEETHRSINTIEAQLKSIYRKLAVKSRTQAVREAMQQGLLNWEGRHELAGAPDPAASRTGFLTGISCTD